MIIFKFSVLIPRKGQQHQGLFEKRKLNPVFFDNLEGCDGVGDGFRKGGIYVYLWLIHVDVWQRSTQYCRAVVLS